MSVLISDKETFDYVFLKYHKSLCFFALKYLKSTEDAEEVVQSIFLKLYEKELSFESHDELRPYLYKSVYHACLNFLRARARQENRDKLYFDQLTEETPAPIHDILRAELIAILQHELTFIPKIQADIIKMSYFEELSNDEIAGALNLSVQTVKNYKNIGLKNIRSRLPKGSLLYSAIGILLNYI